MVLLMNLQPLSPEEIEAIRNTAPWIKVLGSGTLLTLVIALWKAFGLYRRLDDVEKSLKELKDSGVMTKTQHDVLQVTCQRDVTAQIREHISDLRLEWLKEMSEIRESQSSIIGKLDYIIEDRNNRRENPR